MVLEDGDSNEVDYVPQAESTLVIKKKGFMNEGNMCFLYDIISVLFIISSRSFPAAVFVFGTLRRNPETLSEGTFPESFRKASVWPLLKNYNLFSGDLFSYRSISNLSLILKILDRIIQTKSQLPLAIFLLPLSLSISLYSKFHSTETSLLRIHNDLFLAFNQPTFKKVSALICIWYPSS